MADMRSCVKTGCRWPAVATLSYRYATGEVWLSDMSDPHPSTHDLCPHHADSLTVPRGWTLVDDRQPAEAPREPSAAEIVERATRLREGVRSLLTTPAAPEPPRPPSRYAALLANLPTHEPQDGAEEGRAGLDDAVEEDDAPHPREDARAGGVAALDETPADRPAPSPSRAPVRSERADLAPVIREIAATLAAPVVGTLQIDLEDHAERRRDEADLQPATGGLDTADGAEQPPGPPRGAVVLQLPLRSVMDD